ncbi:hypothetical protein C8R48DRAFT_117933 [Suillus tomentosus]|nr:hypothetical protein C8R48DRAFT_117933 [Suillus tomentosus]
MFLGPHRRRPILQNCQLTRTTSSLLACYQFHQLRQALAAELRRGTCSNFLTQIHCIADDGFKVLDTATACNLSADSPDYGCFCAQPFDSLLRGLC